MSSSLRRTLRLKKLSEMSRPSMRLRRLWRSSPPTLKLLLWSNRDPFNPSQAVSPERLRKRTSSLSEQSNKSRLREISLKVRPNSRKRESRGAKEELKSRRCRPSSGWRSNPSKCRLWSRLLRLDTESTSKSLRGLSSLRELSSSSNNSKRPLDKRSPIQLAPQWIPSRVNKESSRSRKSKRSPLKSQESQLSVISIKSNCLKRSENKLPRSSLNTKKEYLIKRSPSRKNLLIWNTVIRLNTWSARKPDKRKSKTVSSRNLRDTLWEPLLLSQPSKRTRKSWGWDISRPRKLKTSTKSCSVDRRLLDLTKRR